MVKSKYNLYSIKGIDYDAVIAMYRKICVEGIKEIDADSISVYSTDGLEYNEKHKPREPLHDDFKILFKAKYLLHAISYRQATHIEDGIDSVTMQAAILRDVIGDDYFELLRAFDKLGYIKCYSPYKVNKQARRYKVLGDIVVTQCSYNKAIEGYIERTKNILLKAAHKRVDERYGIDFRQQYTKNLQKFKIRDTKAFNCFINKNRKPAKIHYYNFLKDCFNSKLEIFSVDSNNRIYHVLTSLKRELKQYLNIKFSIDCKNSHPLLFNYFIFYSKNIPSNIAYKISYILSTISYSDIYDTISNHYVGKNLYKILRNNKIDDFIIGKFTEDELMYIWKTTTGRFWDDIVEENKGKYCRSTIKKRMFAQVFYAKKQKDAIFVNQFKRDYPNVYELVIKWKSPLSYDNLRGYIVDNKKGVVYKGAVKGVDEETALPNLMMSLESDIFHEVLMKLYRKNISAVHIHDAIVVPDSEVEVCASQIEEVMREVYKARGLHPTFSVDTY